MTVEMIRPVRSSDKHVILSLMMQQRVYNHVIVWEYGDARSVPPWESFSAVRTHVGFLHASLVRPDVMAHAVLPLEALLADGAGERLLVRVGEPVSVQVVHVPEGFAAGLARVVFTHGVRVLVYWPLRRSGEMRRSSTVRTTPWDWSVVPRVHKRHVVAQLLKSWNY